jgi:RNA polymerase-binding transcription factor
MSEGLDLEYFKKRLTKRHESILADKEAQKKNTAPKELDQTSVGRLSRMDAMQQQQMSKASARLVDQERRRIGTALKRIENEEYGYCILCDEDIAVKRLEFDPSILTCISCAQNAENM